MARPRTAGAVFAIWLIDFTIWISTCGAPACLAASAPHVSAMNGKEIRRKTSRSHHHRRSSFAYPSQLFRLGNFLSDLPSKPSRHHATAEESKLANANQIMQLHKRYSITLVPLLVLR
jgi:hypothetical protein